MAQPSSIELLPPKDMSKEATKPEQTNLGVKLETTRTLRTKTNITDVAMQGRRSFTFEYEASYHNPRFYEAVMEFSIRLINAPRVANIGRQGYQQFRTTDTESVHTDLLYGPIIPPNLSPKFFFEKATIEVSGGTEIEPRTQTHQITKLIDFHTKMKPEEAKFRYSNLGGYHEDYDAKLASQKYQIPIQINAATGAKEPITGVNYKQILPHVKQWSRSTF